MRVEIFLAKSFWLRLLVICALVYAGFCLLLFLGQRRMIYIPSTEAHALPAGFEEWRSPDGTEHWGWKRITGAKECLFFFHGNSGNARGWAHATIEFPGDIFVLEYPGYGGRPGEPTEESLKEAALRGFKAEHSRYDFVAVCGQSLGSGVTVPIFTRHPQEVDKLILITPFTSIADVARAQFPWVPTGLLLRDRMSVFHEWLKFSGKSLVIVAGRDEVIPPSHGRRYIAERNGVREIIEIEEESHNTIVITRRMWEEACAGN